MRRLIKIKYVWFEGEEEHTYLLTPETPELEKEEVYAESFLKKEISNITNEMNHLDNLHYEDPKRKWFVNCLPHAYEKLINNLTENQGFEEVNVDFNNDDYNFNPTYFVEDETKYNEDETHSMNYYLEKHTTKTERTRI